MKINCEKWAANGPKNGLPVYVKEQSEWFRNMVHILKHKLTACGWKLDEWATNDDVNWDDITDDQSQPFSLIIWASSIIYFPSLYFWLDSNACSCRLDKRKKINKCKRINDTSFSSATQVNALTYFHPSGVLQHSQ